ncbi:MAG: 4Fe-4S binding protein [Bacteroidales bacterium]|nr:4Fe-4S binding protein [Bacteroidales bacterium]
MNQKNLRKFRWVISLLFLVSTALLFVDYRELVPEKWYSTILFLQFIPSLVSFVRVFSIAAAGCLVVLLLTLLFGRIYCSTICPLGILQDFFSFLSRKLRIRKRYRLKKSYSLIRYVFLALPFIFLVFGGIFLVYLLDPYSNFGRIFSGLARPALVGINNVAAGIFEKMHIYFLYPVNYKGFHWATIWFPAGILGLVIWMSFFHGRLYCNTICPVGTLLGLLSRLSLYRIKMDKSTCTRCGKCAVVCKAGCIDFRNMTLDFDRCVGCFNCLDTCDTDSIKYQHAFKSAGNNKMDDSANSKRAFITGTMIYTLGLLGLSKSLKANIRAAGTGNTNLIPEEKNHPVSPPGSISLKHFNDYCTACHLCISVCPTGVLQPSFLEYGFTGMMQPRMDYHTNYCNYDCTRCGEACPTGAILPLETGVKKLTQMGRVKFVIENCVVYTDNTACGSCSEHCPTQAVRMVPYKNGLTIPETHVETCIGCGACEYACPVRPYRAIYVDGNEVHRMANKPHFDEMEIESEEEEFPF